MGVNERGHTLPVAEDGRWADNNDYCEYLRYFIHLGVSMLAPVAVVKGSASPSLMGLRRARPLPQPRRVAALAGAPHCTSGGHADRRMSPAGTTRFAPILTGLGVSVVVGTAAACSPANDASAVADLDVPLADQIHP